MIDPDEVEVDEVDQVDPDDDPDDEVDDEVDAWEVDWYR